jgi:hypothetical protein
VPITATPTPAYFRSANNAAIGWLRSAARGFQVPNAFITMTMFARADLAPDLLGRAAS